MKKIIKKVRLYLFNKRHNTNIKSISSSLSAKYSKGVSIAENTIVTGDVTIAENSYVNVNSSIENCQIGKYCSISSGVYISPKEHNLKEFSTSPKFDTKKNERKQVIIGNDVLISLNSIVLEGVTIGNGAVVGAGSVVTKDILPYEVVGGCPAKHIKFRFDKNVREWLNESRWWDNEELIEEARLRVKSSE